MKSESNPTINKIQLKLKNLPDIPHANVILEEVRIPQIFPIISKHLSHKTHGSFQASESTPESNVQAAFAKHVLEGAAGAWRLGGGGIFVIFMAREKQGLGLMSQLLGICFTKKQPYLLESISPIVG